MKYLKSTLLCMSFFIGFGLAQQGFSKEKKETEKKVQWQKKLIGAINLMQMSYSNWAQGGENSVAWSIRIDGEAKRNGGKWEWLFTNCMTFGQNKQEKLQARTTVDKIDMDGAITWKLGSRVNPYFGVGVLTQFSKGYDYKKTPAMPKSNFWDPAYLTQSAGARVRIKDVFNSQLGIGLKETMTDQYTRYSDNPNTEEVERFRFETGIESKSNLNVNLMQNLQVRSKLELFSSFEHFDVVDIRWDSIFTAKLNKYIVVTLNIQINYDKDVIDKIQIKEMAGIGFSYNFI